MYPFLFLASATILHPVPIGKGRKRKGGILTVWVLLCQNAMIRKENWGERMKKQVKKGKGNGNLLNAVIRFFVKNHFIYKKFIHLLQALW